MSVYYSIFIIKILTKKKKQQQNTGQFGNAVAVVSIYINNQKVAHKYQCQCSNGIATRSYANSLKMQKYTLWTLCGAR